jgi:hypothetical protein
VRDGVHLARGESACGAAGKLAENPDRKTRFRRQARPGSRLMQGRYLHGNSSGRAEAAHRTVLTLALLTGIGVLLHGWPALS